MDSTSLDEYLLVVADGERRRLLDELRRASNGEAPVGDLVDRMRGGNSSGSPVRDGGLDRLATTLHHVHLPKLAAQGIVEYDRERGTVRYRPDPVIEAVLDSLPENSTVVEP